VVAAGVRLAIDRRGRGVGVRDGSG
jgi:hypothetical protein